MITDNEWSEHVMAGEAFAGMVLRLLVVGEYPHAQIFNPVGSGVRIRVYAIEPMAVFAVPINQNIRRYDTPLANLGSFGPLENLLGGGAAPVAELRHENNVALLGSAFWLFLSTGNTRKGYPPEALEWGHDLLPGEGILTSGVVGAFILLGFMWVEVPL